MPLSGRPPDQGLESAPLLVVRIDGDLKRAKALKRPEHEPRLACILAHVTSGKSLNEVADKKL